jgi:hypothetical protein
MSVSVTPEKLHELLTYCIDFGKVMLGDSGEFYPFGATLGPDGVVSAAGGYDGNERPKPAEIYGLLGKAFSSRAMEGSIVAAALAVNVNIPKQFSSPSPDGIRIHLEAIGFSRLIYVPYVLNKRGLIHKTIEVTLFEPFAVQSEATMFPGTADA